MKIIVLLLGISLFSAYFYWIGSWYFSFLPLWVFLVLLLIHFSKYKNSFSYKDVSPKYLFLSSWILVNIALYLVFVFFWIPSLESILALVWINLLSLIVGYLAKIPYAEDISYTTYLLSCWALLGYSFFTPWLSSWDVLFYLSSFTLGILAFVQFVLALYFPIASYFKYHLFLTGVLTCILFVLNNLSLSSGAFLLSFVLLVIVIAGVFFILDYDNEELKNTKNKEITVRRILAGERILPEIRKQKSQKNKKLPRKLLTLQEYIQNFPLYIKYFLESLNVILFIAFLVSYFVIKKSLFFWGFVWEYWGILLLFLGNILLLKRVEYTSILQKFGMFFGINILIYSIFFSFSHAISSNLVLYLVLANLLYSGLLFHIEAIFPMIWWNKKDYFFALGVDILAILANVILLAYLDISWQIIFALAFLYIAVKILLFFSLLNKVSKINTNMV